MSFHLVVGLGNPGKSYAYNRHNIGFMFLDYITQDKGWKSGHSGLYCKRDRVIFLKPSTYMNNSGISVASMAKFYQISTNNIIVIHDDIDISLGDIRTKQGGSAAGHNGLKSIDKHVSQLYWRIRIGVGRPKIEGMAVADYVLQNFASKENSMINDEIFPKAHDILTSLLANR